MIKPLFWKDKRLFIVDQTLLPAKYSLIEIRNHLEMADAIKRLAIRGAPAIGIAAAFGLVISLKDQLQSTRRNFFSHLYKNEEILNKTRPTAVNLSWALERMKKTAKDNKNLPIPELWERLLSEAKAIHKEDIHMCKAIAEYGYKLLPDKVNVITHCNTGGLATGGLGTALGIIIKAFQKGKDVHVYVNETRPLLQGARLTAWELTKEKVPFTLCTDNMAAYIMTNKNIDAVVVGADRIAGNGDTANKIGTYSLAILANYHKIPFYIAAPTSTIDPTISSGKDIVVEERSGSEVTNFLGKHIAPENCKAISPAFDITPSNLISRIITEKGIFKQPFYLFQQSYLKTK